MSQGTPPSTRSEEALSKGTVAGPSLQVFVFKEGMLSRLGHDLRLSSPEVQISVAQGHVTAQLVLASLMVDGALHDGVLTPGTLDEAERARILSHLRDDVLDVPRHPAARYEAQAREQSPGRYVLTGDLTLHGITNDVAVQVELDDSQMLASFELTPSRWGIKPFRALAGALRVQDRVRIAVRAPLPEGVALRSLGQTSFAMGPI